jgi:hypothetical protein
MSGHGEAVHAAATHALAAKSEGERLIGPHPPAPHPHIPHPIFISRNAEERYRVAYDKDIPRCIADHYEYPNYWSDCDRPTKARTR